MPCAKLEVECVAKKKAVKLTMPTNEDLLNRGVRNRWPTWPVNNPIDIEKTPALTKQPNMISSARKPLRTGRGKSAHAQIA